MCLCKTATEKLKTGVKSEEGRCFGPLHSDTHLSVRIIVTASDGKITKLNFCSVVCSVYTLFSILSQRCIQSRIIKMSLHKHTLISCVVDSTLKTASIHPPSRVQHSSKVNLEG